MTHFKGTGGQILAKILADQGVARLSCVAGESYLAVLDALLDHPQISVITCRHEGGAAFMAESWGKLYGTPGICFVTRGPGACNASIGVHTAMQDSTPMILFMGQVRRWEKGREAFQEIDVAQVFGGLAKWAVEIDDPKRIPEIVSRAFVTAISGRPGPVVIGLPEDMLTETAEVELPARAEKLRAPMTAEQGAAIHDILKQAQKPLMVVGGSGWDDKSCVDIVSFAASCHLPVAAAFRRQDVFSHKNNCYVGELGTGPNPKLIAKVKEADVILAVGTRLSEIMSQGYTLFHGQKLIHIHPSEKELNKVYPATLAIRADVDSAAAILSARGFGLDGRRWAGWRDELRALYNDWTQIDAAKLPRWKGANMHAIYAWLQNNLPEDSIVTTDAGNFSGWAQRYLRYGRPGRLLAPTSGAMGYAVPAALGAALAEPKRLTLGICGDGGFMMTGQELASAIHHGAAPIIMVCNNGMYGTIRMHQEKHYPGRVSATALTNPDFTALAASYGVFAAKIEDAADFPEIFRAARESANPAILEVKMDPRQLTTGAAP